jgi:hypothetical protein
MAWANDGYDHDVCKQGVRKALVQFVLSQDSRFTSLTAPADGIVDIASLRGSLVSCTKPRLMLIRL